jgi:eukaryotic-like serine/threonine-protein kinase
MNIARREQNFPDISSFEAGLGARGDQPLRDELPPASILGRVLMNRYVPDALLAEGPFSVRYRADDLSTGESVCVEFLPRRAIGSWSHIRQAAAKLAGLGNPNIVEVLGRGMAGGAWPFLVTEYGKTRSLRDVLRDGPELELARVVRIGAMCAEALVAAHGVGVLHGGLCPERVVTSDASGQHESFKVSGFGIASLIEASPEALLASSAELYPYVSPEQVAGQRLEARSDIYSVGAILYELATGRAPFRGNASSVLRQHRTAEPEPVSRLRGSSELGFRVLDKIIARCLAKEPGQRYARAAELLVDLARLGAALGRGSSGVAKPLADGRRGSRPRLCLAPERKSDPELRPPQYPPKSRVGLRKLPKVIVRDA